MSHQAGMKGRLNISGTLQWRDKDGNVIATTEIKGAVPLDRFSEDEQRQLIKDIPHGTDNC